jgi:hypothetical protein
MAMKAVVLEGNQAGSDEGEGGVLQPLWEQKGEAIAHVRAGGGGIMAKRPEEEDEGVGPMRQ